MVIVEREREREREIPMRIEGKEKLILSDHGKRGIQNRVNQICKYFKIK